MKKVFLFVTAAVAALTMLSCNKEIETPMQGVSDPACPDGYYVEELTAVYPHDPETRTAFNETTGRFAWTEGDELAFHLSNGEYIAAPIDPATGKVKLYLPVGVTRDNYAVYPAASVVDEAAEIGNMQVTLPDIYDITGNLVSDFVPTPLVAWNDAENTHLKFEHVGGLLQINLNVPAGTKTASVSLGKEISGTFDLVEGSGNGVINPGEAGDDAVVFVLSQTGLRSDSDVKLLLPVPAGTYESIELLYNDGNEDTFRFTKDLSEHPWTFARSGGKKMTINESSFDNLIPDYFWLENASGKTQTISFKQATDTPVTLYYTKDGVNWTLWDFQDISFNNKERVYFYGDNEVFNNYGWSNSNNFKVSGTTKCGGDILTLLKKRDAVMHEYDFAYLFYKCSYLNDASQLILPDYTAENCYDSMFYGATNLWYPPVLPATVLSKRCYASMFESTHITTPPELPAPEMEEGCYGNMFAFSWINVAPELPSTELADYCYSGMLRSCTNIKVAPVLPATKMAKACYQSMLENTQIAECPELPATELAEDCYTMMFESCSKITTGPDLPATVVPRGAYSYMFKSTRITTPPAINPELTTVGQGAMRGMFASCYYMETPPVLNATNLSTECYNIMFQYCSALTTAPELPATVMKDGCYKSMFEHCTSLVNVPASLPAMTLANNCYQYMFDDCKSLEVAPALPATKFVNFYNYAQMFRGCKSLKEIPALPATTVSGYAYESMFQNCTSLTNVKLTATNIGTRGYYSMFKGCTGLKKAELMATKCSGEKSFDNMFMDCTSLEELTVHFTAWPDYSNPSTAPKKITTTNWVSGVPETGKFIKPEALPCSVENGVAVEGDYTGPNNIPLGWTVYNIGSFDEVGAGF